MTAVNGLLAIAVFGFSDRCWKLIYYPKVEQWQLFDLEKDPLELQNLAPQPEHNRQVKDLTQKLQALMSASGDALSLALH
jgi:5'(3')-deoxyribonucleotidase